MAPRLDRLAQPRSVAVLSALDASVDASELRETPIVKAVQRARASVVNIRGEKTVPLPPDRPPAHETSHRVNGMGTGVVIDPRGYIITNHHVVDGVREIQVTMADERAVCRQAGGPRPGNRPGHHQDRPPSKPLPVMPIGTSSDLMPGESVIAVGNAYGYEHTVTRGIVSALHRAVQVSDAQFYDDLIQTDASINPGNSGGPLLNIDGEMIGINVAVRAGAQGIGFAIPVDKVDGGGRHAAGSAATSASVDRVVAVETTRPPRSAGMTVAVEDEEPRRRGGLLAGDVITAVEDIDVQRPLDFQRAMLDRKPGEKVAVGRRRGQAADAESDAGRGSRSGEDRSPARLGPAGPGIEAGPGRRNSRRNTTRYRGGLAVADRAAGQPGRQPRHRRRRRAGGHAHLGDRVAGERRLHSQAARIRQPQPGEVLHPPRRRNAVWPLGPQPGEDRPAVSGVVMEGSGGRVQGSGFRTAAESANWSPSP